MIKQPRGTQDILPDRWAAWEHVYQAAETVAEGAGYGRIETPMFERTALFVHATGEHTDVNREMYTFQDRGGEELSLRPEGTASVVRAYFEHGMKVLAQPVKLYYLGSMFRYERPQAGRFREHHQFGCEAIGSEDALVDASLVTLQRDFYRRCSIPAVRIQVNSIGDGACRPAFIRELVAYLQAHRDKLCGQCRERIESNPLRVLDCKVPCCQPVLDAAPQMIDRLCDECRGHWHRFLAGVEAAGLTVSINRRLVRGLDYYTRTVWEFLPDAPGGAQSVLGGGGRYDALAEAIGAPATPGVGFSTGLERVLLNLVAGASQGRADHALDVFVVTHGMEAELQGLELLVKLWQAGVKADMAFDNRSLATQLRRAEAGHAGLALVIGERELETQMVGLRRLETRKQDDVPAAGVVDAVISIVRPKERDQ